jgi:hypothetical protein
MYQEFANQMITLFNELDIKQMPKFQIQERLFGLLIVPLDRDMALSRSQASRIVQEIDIDVCEEAFQELGGLTPGSKMNELIGSMADLILRYNFELEQAGMGPIQGFSGNLKLN